MSTPPGSTNRRIEEAWLARGSLARLLWPLTLIYRPVSALRRRLYKHGILQTQRLDVPVLVVGNLIAGGAGKTPAVLACVRLLRSLGYTPGIISRGYRPRAQQGEAAPAAHARRQPVEVLPHSDPAVVGDEPLLLRLRSGAPVVVCADRVLAGQMLRHEHPEVDIVVSDDGLQHLRLARDGAVIVFDERGIGNGWQLPAGPLREPLPARVPPRSVVLYNAPWASTKLPGFTARPALTGLVPLAAWRAGLGHLGMSALDTLRGHRVLAAAGVARPERFFAMLEKLGLTIDRWPLPDHYAFAAGPHQPSPWPHGYDDVVVTEKDAVKLQTAGPGGPRIWVVALDFDPEPGFSSALKALFPGPLPSSNRT